MQFPKLTAHWNPFPREATSVRYATEGCLPCRPKDGSPWLPTKEVWLKIRHTSNPPLALLSLEAVIPTWVLSTPFGNVDECYIHGCKFTVYVCIYLRWYVYSHIYIYTASRISCNQCIDGHIMDGHYGLATWSPKSSQGFHSIPSWSVEKSAFE